MYKLLQNTAIKTYIDERLKQLEDERIASAAEVMNGVCQNVSKLTEKQSQKELTEELKALEELKELKMAMSKALITQPSLSAANTLMMLYKDSEICADGTKGISIVTTVNELKKQIERVKSADLSEIEAILTSQITVLNHFFCRYMSLGIRYHNGEVPLEKIMALYTLGLKMQEQSRKTASTLVNLKAPRQTAFIKQFNQAHNQQIMNGQQGDNIQNSEKNSGNSSNEILEGEKLIEPRMDTRTIYPASGEYQEMEAVGINYGAKNSGRKTKVIEKCS